MSSSISIRVERPDQPEVVALLGALDDYLATLFPPEANHILDVQALCAPDIVFLVARDGEGRAVGTGACRVMPAEPATESASAGRAYGEIKRMYVDPACRGQRLGARLLAALEAALRERGVTLALLETGDTQVEARRLYETAGYRPCGPFGGYPDNGLSVFYAKALA